MRNRKLFNIILAVLILGLLGWWAWMANRPEPTVAPAMKKVAKAAPVNPPAKTATVSQPPSKEAIIQSRNLPSAAEIEAAENDPKLTAEERAELLQDPNKAAVYARFEKMIAGLNSRPLDLYGKVVDQDGQPVAGAQVKGGILLAVSQISSESKEVVTETDAAGKFQFVGLHGMDFGVIVQKTGYELRSGTGWTKDYQPDPENPMIFTMWKLQGAEPMAHVKFDSRVPYDGTSATFDLLTGKKSDTGDLKITLLRNPVQLKPGQDHYEWNVKIEILGGGIIQSHDPYPYEAPETGYQPEFDFAQTKDGQNWTRELQGVFYVHTATDYGRVRIDLFTDAQRPDTGLTVEAYVNPSGSRNLEWDSKNQIKSK